jgi:hypothetical protein
VDRPLEEFLFLRKTGYCEHYATAMAIMLRTVGIPARLVTGFLATEWNEYGSYYVVRQQDAHAWIEVYLPHSGWVMMDPTPPSGEPMGDVYPAWRALERILDNVKLQWSRFFVQYSAGDQLAVVRELKAGGQSVRHKALDSMATLFSPILRLLGGIPDYVFSSTLRPQGSSWGLIVVACIILLVLSVKRILARAFPDKKRTHEDHRIVDLYKQMIKRLADKGIAKTATTTPLEFVHIARIRWSEADLAVASITELYCRARFGGIPLTEEELGVAEDRLRCLTMLGKS